MNASIIRFPLPKTQPVASYITRYGAFADDELPPELFDHDEDMSELSLYITIADHWND